MVRLGWIAWSFVVGCSFTPTGAAVIGGVDAGPNSGSGSAGPGSGSAGSGSGSATTGCAVGVRMCIDAAHSGTCDGSGNRVIDRNCPPGSMCGSGYCQPPSGAMPCTSDDDCSNSMVCDPYVAGSAFAGFCTARAGNGQTYDSCSSNIDCRTGVCTDGECYAACSTTSDCPEIDTKMCEAGSGSLEGVSMSGLTTCVGHD